MWSECRESSRRACLLALGLSLLLPPSAGGLEPLAEGAVGPRAAPGRLPPRAIEYLGRFDPPPPAGDDRFKTWNWGMRGMSLVPDCLGRPDPTPDDGYPGCMGALGHIGGDQYGVFDLVPPGGTAQQVVPFWEVGAPLRDQTWPGNPGSHSYRAALYDKGPGYCRIWWTYGNTYAGRAKDKPFLAYSSCDPANPSPVGLWDFGRERGTGNQADPFQTSKMYQGLSRIPALIADRLFDGKQMLIGGSPTPGTRGGSQGPALYVRHLDPPSVAPPGPARDATPLVWYLKTAFLSWTDVPQMNGPAVHWWTRAQAYDAEFVSAPEGEAVIMPWREPTVNPEDYPCSDPDNPYTGDPDTPEPCLVPVCWYGLGRCFPDKPEGQQPSFWEYKRDGSTRMPVDCNLSTKGGFLGPRCLSERRFLIFYDVDELARVYRGEIKHNVPQPYAKIQIDVTEGLMTSGAAYDELGQRLYVSQGGKDPAVHVFRIGGEWQGPACGDGECEAGEPCNCVVDCGECGPPASRR